MTEEAVMRAIQSAAREAFAIGMQAKGMPGSDRDRMKQTAISYAETLLLPVVGMAIQEALEAQWIDEHGTRQPAPDRTL